MRRPWRTFWVKRRSLTRRLPRRIPIEDAGAGHRSEMPRVRGGRARDANQSGAGGDDVRVQTGSGNQVQPDYQLDGRFVPGAEGGIDFDRTDTGKIDDWH